MDPHQGSSSPSMAYFSSSPPGLHHSSPAYQSFCRLCCTHSWQFHPCPRSDWREIWLAWSMIGTKHWHWCSLLSFVLIFSGSRQCFSFGIGSFSFTEGTPFFLNLFLFFFFNLFSYLWRTDRRLHAINPDMLLERTWTLTVPCSPSGFRAAGSWLYCSLRVWGCVG